MAKNLTNNLTFWSHCLQVDGSGHSEQIAESFSRLQLFTKGCVNLSIKYFYRRRLLQLEQRLRHQCDDHIFSRLHELLLPGEVFFQISGRSEFVIFVVEKFILFLIVLLDNIVLRNCGDLWCDCNWKKSVWNCTIGKMMKWGDAR